MQNIILAPLSTITPRLSFPSRCVLSHVPLFAIPWTVPCQVPLSMGFSRLMHEAGYSKLVLWDNPEEWGRKGDREGGEEGSEWWDTCTPVADSCRWMGKPPQYCKAISLQLKLINFKKVLEWVAIAFSGGSPQTRERTPVSVLQSLALSHREAPFPSWSPYFLDLMCYRLNVCVSPKFMYSHCKPQNYGIGDMASGA